MTKILATFKKSNHILDWECEDASRLLRRRLRPKRTRKILETHISNNTSAATVKETGIFTVVLTSTLTLDIHFPTSHISKTLQSWLELQINGLIQSGGARLSTYRLQTRPKLEGQRHKS